MQQLTDEWFKARLGKATASRFADVIATIRSGEAAVRRNYRTQLVVERVTGIPQDDFTSKPMQWGIETEPLARMAYELRTGNKVKEVGFVKHKVLEAGASPDGLIGKDGVLEIKCPNSSTHLEYLKGGIMPSDYYAQVQGQMWITGRKWCDFVSYDPRMPEHAQLLIVRVERNDLMIEDIAAKVELFLREVDADEKFLREYK